MLTPRSSIDVTIAIADRARQMKIPTRLETSLIPSSDSRYVILFPGTVEEAIIRVSSHLTHADRYALDINIAHAKAIEDAQREGIDWLEKTYGDGTIQALAERGGLARAHPDDIWSGRNGRERRRRLLDITRPKEDRPDRVRRSHPRRVRNTGPLKERPRGEGRRICFEQPGDD